MSLFHVKTLTVADGTATTVVRPSDWNSGHVHAMTLSGNTAGASSFTAGNVILQGGNNVTLSASAAAGVATILFSAANPTPAFAFADSNGISFGTNGPVVTATVKTDYLTTAAESNHAHSQYLTTAQPVGAYLTTAAQSDHAHSQYQNTSNTSAITANAMNTAERANYFYTSNNTFAHSTHSHGAVAFSGTNVSGSFTSQSNGISIQLSAAAAGGGGGAALSAGTQSANTGTVAFANSNGITFGMSGSNQITASHNGLTTAAQSNHSHNFATTTTNGSQIVVATTNSAGATIAVPPFLTTAQAPGAYLTTARASNDAIGLNTALTANGVSMTANSSGLSLNFPAFLTTAAQSSASNVSGLLAGTNSAGGTVTLSGNVSFSNANGVSFYTSAGNAVVATVKTDYLTTAMQSQMTSNYMSTAERNNYFYTSNNTFANSTHSHGMVTTTTNGSQVTIAGNSGGYTLAVPPFVTAAAGGGDGFNILGVNAVATSLSSTYILSNANNVSFGLNAGTITASASYAAQTVDTNKAGTGVTTAGGAGVSATLNTNGLSMSIPAWLTTAAQSNHSHGNPTLALTNINGTTASASNGLTLSLSAVVPAQTNQTANLYVAGNTTQLSSTAGIDLRSVSFEGAGIASVGVSNGRVLVSVPAGGGGGDGVNVIQMGAGGNSAGATYSASTGTVHLFGGDNITLSQNNNSITFSGAAGGGATSATHTMWFPFNEAVNVMGQQGQGTLHLVPVPTPDVAGGMVSIDRLCLPILLSASSNSSGSCTISHWFGLYTRNGASISLAHSTSHTLAVTYSGSANTTAYSGVRLLTIPWTTTIADNRYIVANISRTTTSGTGCTISQVLVSNMNSNFSGVFNVNTATSNQWPLGWGVYSATTSALPASIAYSQIVGTGSLAMRNPEWFMVSGTI